MTHCQIDFDKLSLEHYTAFERVWLSAPLEQVGNWIDVLLDSNVVTRPFAAISQIRSSGITDLRCGHVLESSWLINGKEVDRFERSPVSHEPLPLPAGVACFKLVATSSSEFSPVMDQLLGDRRVPLRSALGLHDEARHTLAIEAQNQWVVSGVSHSAQLNRPEVTAQLLQWLA